MVSNLGRGAVSRKGHALVLACVCSIDFHCTGIPRHGIHANTIRLWKEKHAGLETSDLKTCGCSFQTLRRIAKAKWPPARCT